MSFAFDASTVDPNSQFDPIPAGWYACRIASVDLKATGAGHDMLKFTFEVDHANGSFGGRKLFLNLVVGHPNEQTRAIAKRQLSSICHAVGVLQLTEQNLGDLCGRLLDVRVVIKNDANYGEQNEVKQTREHLTRRPEVKQPGRFTHNAAPKRQAMPQDLGEIPF